jgi:hypothetical protein
MVSQLRGFVSALFFACGMLLATGTFAQVVVADHTTKADPPAVELARLLVDKESAGWGTAPSMDFMVALLVRQLDPDHGHGWTPEDPLWKHMETQVRKDCATQWDALVKDRREAAANAYVQSFQSGLSDAQVSELISLYRSPEGQRYLAFSAEIFDLYLQVIGRAQEDGVRDAVRRAFAEALRPDNAAVDERLMLAAGSRYLLAQTGGGAGGALAATPNASRGDATLAQQLVLMKVVSKIAPERLDAMFAAYRSDIPAIRKMEENPLVGIEIKRSTAYGPDPNTFLRAVRPFMPSWKAAYWAARARQQGTSGAR